MIATGPPWWREPVVALLGAAVVLGLVQAVVLDPPGRILRATVPFALAALAAVAVRVTAGARRTAGDLDGAGGRPWLLALATVGTGLGLWAIVTFLAAWPDGWDQPSGFYRVKLGVTTPLGDHNTAAGLLLVAVVATAVLAADDRRWWGPVALIGLGLVATLSRGAAAVLLLVAVASWLVRTRRAVAAGLTVVAVVALGAITGLAAVLDASPPAETAREGVVGTSILGRVDLVVRGVEVAADHPVVGVGLGGFVDHVDGLPPPNHHAHNAFAHAAAEGGVPLLLIAVAVVGLLAWRAWRLPPGWRREVTLLGGAALVAHAQLDILSGLVGYEVTLAVLAVLAADPGRRVAAPSGGLRGGQPAR